MFSSWVAPVFLPAIQDQISIGHLVDIASLDILLVLNKKAFPPVEKIAALIIPDGSKNVIQSWETTRTYARRRSVIPASGFSRSSVLIRKNCTRPCWIQFGTTPAVFHFPTAALPGNTIASTLK